MFLPFVKFEPPWEYMLLRRSCPGWAEGPRSLTRRYFRVCGNSACCAAIGLHPAGCKPHGHPAQRLKKSPRTQEHRDASGPIRQGALLRVLETPRLVRQAAVGRMRPAMQFTLARSSTGINIRWALVTKVLPYN